MSLVFAGITPHTPLLLEELAKEKTKLVTNSIEALSYIAEDLHVARPDIILVISPYTAEYDDSFTINAHESFENDFSEFGNMSATHFWKGTPHLAAQIERLSRSHNSTTATMSEQKLDYGISIPLVILTPSMPNICVLPIGTSELDKNAHLEFGTFLKEAIMQSDKRIAVVMSGHLSHALTVDAPEGFNVAGPEFDQKLQAFLASADHDSIIQMDVELIEDAKETIYKPLLILLGLLRGHDAPFESYCYEAPLGVGYLTGIFHI